MSEQLLERDAELRALSDGLDLVRRTGSGAVVLVAGEAGVGKTTLLRRFRADRPATTQVLWGGLRPAVHATAARSAARRRGRPRR